MVSSRQTVPHPEALAILALRQGLVSRSYLHQQVNSAARAHKGRNVTRSLNNNLNKVIPKILFQKTSEMAASAECFVLFSEFYVHLFLQIVIAT